MRRLIWRLPLTLRFVGQCGDGQLYEQGGPFTSSPAELSATNGQGSSSSHAHSNCCEEVHHHHHHPITSSASSSSSDSHRPGSEEDDDDGYASDGTELLGHRKSISSIASSNKPLPPVPGGRSKGFELCAGCIEEHGREHARSFFRSRAGPAAVAGRVKGEVGHTFRERVWAGGGWKDVGQSQLQFSRRGTSYPRLIVSSDLDRVRRRVGLLDV